MDYSNHTRLLWLANLNKDDPDEHQQALDDSEPLVHEHVMWALEKLAMRGVLPRQLASFEPPD